MHILSPETDTALLDLIQVYLNGSNVTLFQFVIKLKEITKKANRTLGFVKRNIKTKNQSVKEFPYKTLVRINLQTYRIIGNVLFQNECHFVSNQL